MPSRDQRASAMTSTARLTTEIALQYKEGGHELSLSFPQNNSNNIKKSVKNAISAMQAYGRSATHPDSVLVRGIADKEDFLLSFIDDIILERGRSGSVHFMASHRKLPKEEKYE